MKVLVTRPQPGADATSGLLAAMGFEAVALPCLEIERLAPPLPERPAALLLTSGQAVAMLPRRYAALPCFCVGDATAARLREAGFTAVESAAGDAGDLFRLVVARRLAGTHLLAVGKGNGIELAERLRRSGIALLRREVYGTRVLTALPAAIRAALAAGAIGQALFYSVATLRAFARLRPPGTAGMMALALSPAIAGACAELPWRAIRAAASPNEAALLALLHAPEGA